MLPPKEVPISPELVLVDRHLADSVEVVRRRDAQSQRRVIPSDTRSAVLRICELSDVNPPRRTRRPRLLAYSGVATLWLEAVLIATAQGISLR